MENEVPPTPVIKEESIIKLIREMKKNEKYEIKFLSTNTKLYIQYLNKTFPYIKYENEYTLNNLIDVHKYFVAFEDINEVCSFLKSTDENSIKISEKNENIIVTIKCIYKVKLIDINFGLLKTKTNYDKISLEMK